MQGIIGDTNRPGLRGKGNPELVDGQEDSPGGIWDDVVRHEWFVGTLGLGLVQGVNALLQALFHRKSTDAVLASEPLHPDREESAAEVEGFGGHVHEPTKTYLSDGVDDSGPPFWVLDGVKFFRVITEVIGVAVAGRKVIVEFVASCAHKRGGKERVCVEEMRVLRILLALEGAAGVGSLEEDFFVLLSAEPRNFHFSLLMAELA